MTGNATGDDLPVIRETYEVCDADGGSVAVIADPDNEEAWIESDIVQGVVP